MKSPIKSTQLVFRDPLTSLSSILSGVKYLHDNDIVHRDLKCVILCVFDAEAPPNLTNFQAREHSVSNKRFCIGYRDSRFWNVRLLNFYMGEGHSIHPRFSAKHLHSSEEQLHSMAGSFGYVAPEVLNRKGHGKPVDIWSIGYVLRHLFVDSNTYRPFSVITYVLLCGYAPFRSEDPKELVRETMAARIQFHDRYWKNVSQEGATTTSCTTLHTTPTHTSVRESIAKDFIRLLLSPDPYKRPTAAGALSAHVRTPFSDRPPRNSHHP